MKLRIPHFAGPACLLLTLALQPGAAAALSLGEAQIESRYGQPLRLRVPIELGSEDEQADAGLVQAKLMGEDYYEARGVAPPEIPTEQLSIRTERADGRTWAVVTSERTLREPMMTLFVTIRLGASQITREVPVLLDFQPRAPVAPVPAAAPVAVAIDSRSTPEPPPVATAAPVVEAVVASPAEPPRKRRRRPSAEPLTLAEDPPPGVVIEATPTDAPANGLRMDSVLSRPDGYTRFRLDETFASARLAGPLPPPAAAPAPVADEAPVADAAFDAEPSTGFNWHWLWLLLLLPVGYLLLRLRTRAKTEPPAPALLISAATFQPPPPATKPKTAAEADMEMPAVAEPIDFAPEPQPAAEPTLPLLSPPMTMPEVPVPSGLHTEGYPHHDLRERVTQLARQTSAASDKRKLELVKAYIDVERPDSAEKLLTELEEKHYGSSRPDRLDFELS